LADEQRDGYVIGGVKYGKKKQEKEYSR
jgi:hypothetical protein